MKKWLGVVMALSVLIGLGQAADTSANKSTPHFNQRVQQINKQTEDPKVMQVALQHIATETGVPLDQVRAQHKSHPKYGGAALLLANVLAAETKKSPESFLKERSSGKEWVEIAQENKIPTDKLNVRLDRIERAIAPAVQTGK